MYLRDATSLRIFQFERSNAMSLLRALVAIERDARSIRFSRYSPKFSLEFSNC